MVQANLFVFVSRFLAFHVLNDLIGSLKLQNTTQDEI